MHRTVLLRAVFPPLICTIAVLWLVWGYLDLPVLLKGALTVLGGIVVLLLAGQRYRRQRSVVQHADGGIYPPEGFTGPVLLVCGDVSDNLFAESPCRTTAQGCYLQVASTEQLHTFAGQLLAREPMMAGQLVVMFRCLPGLHEDEGELQASLKTLRQQVKQLKALSGYTPPVVISGEFSGPETPWMVLRGNSSLVCPPDEPALSFGDWLLLPENADRLPFLSHAMAFMQQVILDELAKVDPLCPAISPFAVVMRTGHVPVTMQALWSQWLFRHTRLLPPVNVITCSPLWHFADPVLALLAPYARPLQGGETGRRVVMVLLLCALAAVGQSVMHNQRLIQRVSANLQRWQAIPMTHYIPKAQALHVLQQEALLLERWQRQGVPQRYGLGLYPGERLWLSIQQAIDTYVPQPPPPPKPEPKAVPVPKMVRLDSLSLFDSGKAELKAGSTKMLVNSLVDIKARPGWLIVVSGHTDNTGSPQQNQALSLKRAAAVRDWMRDTGDVPESCFAVQGYGESRPVADNDTPEGRALNRRVEISLVPQADACQLPDSPPPSSQDGDGF
ncbi:OmpA family protein [Erwinia endophytica]|uniref:OmpA family protein n=1 Tax=Erwinia endophytica TaxID=1563158 RepID=UPI001265F104|nr:OmpA family protein [Erwinia endophytica]KAB8313786.1 OmpA family protein [Erwinia endophytica]